MADLAMLRDAVPENRMRELAWQAREAPRAAHLQAHGQGPTASANPPIDTANPIAYAATQGPAEAHTDSHLASGSSRRRWSSVFFLSFWFSISTSSLLSVSRPTRIQRALRLSFRSSKAFDTSSGTFTIAFTILSRLSSRRSRRGGGGSSYVVRFINGAASAARVPSWSAVNIPSMQYFQQSAIKPYVS